MVVVVVVVVERNNYTDGMTRTTPTNTLADIGLSGQTAAPDTDGHRNARGSGATYPS